MKLRALFPLLLCAVLLTGCSGLRPAPEVHTGTVTDCTTDENGQVTAFVLTDDHDRSMEVAVDGETTFFCDSLAINHRDFAQLQQDGLEAAVTYYDNGLVSVHLLCHRTDTVLPLEPQGEAVLWESVGGDSYRLADGTELLWVAHTSGPANVHVEGIPSLNQMPEEAQAAILAYYDEQGPLYDAMAELQKAYDAYTALEDPADFTGFSVRQEVSPTAVSDQYAYFLTIVTLPLYDGQNYTEIRYGTAFDRETGRFIPPEALFTCEADELAAQLLDRAKLSEDSEQEAMLDAFDPAHLVFFPETLQLFSPEGTLVGQEYARLVALPYPDLSGLIRSVAVPHDYEN